MQLAAGPALVCRPLETHAAHFLTTRAWQLGSPSAPVDLGWQEIAQAIDVGSTHLARVRQVHGAATLVRRGGQSGTDHDASRPLADIADSADIIVSDASAWALAIQTADCLPLLIADPRTGAVAAAHAGWRGLALSVPVVTVERLASEFGSRPADLIVAIGPAIGACCYEVGEDVRARFEKGAFGPAQMARWFTVDPRASASNSPMPSLPSRRRAQHWFFDLWQTARDQLESAGVPADRIWVAGLCTASHAGAFCSYRRDGAAARRMAAIIRCRPRP